MASRREARMNAAQNDALLELESFRKKYLLVNKHVTKLNSTLNVRMEELNVQISKLQLENLHLRTTNLSLIAQLKRERVLKGRDAHTVALVDAATAEALRQLTAIRDAIVNPSHPAISPPHAIPTPPSTSPAAAPTRINVPVHPGPSTRLPVARAPEFSTLTEMSETPRSRRRSSGAATTDESDSDMEHYIRVSRTRPALGARYASARSQAESETESEVDIKNPRQIRRQSGLLGRDVVAQPDVEDGGLETNPERLDLAEQPIKSKARTTISSSSSSSSTEPKRTKRKLVESDIEDPIKSVGVIVDVPDENDLVNEENSKPLHSRTKAVVGTTKLQDVTNSPRRTVSKLKDKAQLIDKVQLIEDEPAYGATTGYIGTPAVSKTKLPRTRVLIPTPAPSSDRLTPTPINTDDEAASNGRERRNRKSVNYAEPKLNTKMRKPTPDATSYGRFSLPTSRPRISTSIPRDPSPAPESPMPPLLPPSKSDAVSAKAESPSDDAVGVTLRAARRRRPVPSSWGVDEDGGGEDDLDADDEYVPHAGGVRRKSSTKTGEARY